MSDPIKSVPQELKRDLLEDACRLQFGAAIRNALHRLSIQLARLNQLGSACGNSMSMSSILNRRAAVIDHGDVLQQETLKIASAFQRVGPNC